MMWWYGGNSWSWPWALGGMLWMVLFWGAVIWVFVWAVSRFTQGGSPGGSANDSPLDIARRRYARGEISREEFERIKADLS